MTYKVFVIIDNWKRDVVFVDGENKDDAVIKAKKTTASVYNGNSKHIDNIGIDTVTLDDTRYRLEYLDGGWKKDSDHDTMAEARKAQRKLHNMTGYKTRVWAYQYWREV